MFRQTTLFKFVQSKEKKKEEFTKLFILVHPNLELRSVLTLQDEISLIQLVHN